MANFQILANDRFLFFSFECEATVCKTDREQSEKNVFKERLKIPKRYLAAIVFENFLKD
jgi:hypothetical protein